MMICLLCGCAKTVNPSVSGGEDKSIESDQTALCRAMITEIEGDMVLVTPQEGAEELKSSDSFRVPVKDMPEASQLRVGDMLEIAYNGSISEVYPAEFDGIKSVTVAERAENPDTENADEKSTDGENVDAKGADPEKTSGDYPPCVMIDGVVYKDTGYNDSMLGCGNMDGEILSSVDGSQLPTEDNQSNFGTGYGYQGSSAGQIVVVIDDEKRIFRDMEIDDDSIPEQVINFQARVKEQREDGTLLVSYVSMPEGFLPMPEGDYVVSKDNLRDEVRVGDTVTIWFNGSIEETDPAQIGTVYRIEKTR